MLSVGITGHYMHTALGSLLLPMLSFSSHSCNPLLLYCCEADSGVANKHAMSAV